MEPLEVRIVTPAERRARLNRLSGYIEPEQMMDIIEVSPSKPTTRMPTISDDQIKAAHEAFFKGGFTRIETIQRATLVEFKGITLADLKSRRRTANVVWPRQIAMYLSKDMTTQSLPDIGRRFGDRDHTTVIHSINKVEARARLDRELFEMLDRIRKRVETAQ